MILSGLVTAFLLAGPAQGAPANGVSLFLDDVAGGRAPATCVQGALKHLRVHLARDGRVRLVQAREKAALVVDVRECGSRWETRTSGEVGVVVAVGGPGPAGTTPARGTATQAGVGVKRQLSGYVVLRARAADRAPEFTSLPHTELFEEALSVTAEQLLEWVGEHAGELSPR